MTFQYLYVLVQVLVSRSLWQCPDYPRLHLQGQELRKWGLKLGFLWIPWMCWNMFNLNHIWTTCLDERSESWLKWWSHEEGLQRPFLEIQRGNMSNSRGLCKDQSWNVILHIIYVYFIYTYIYIYIYNYIYICTYTNLSIPLRGNPGLWCAGASNATYE